MMYHWGPIDECVIPAVLGYFPEEQMKKLVSRSQDGVVGGGFYVSEFPTDTMHYGSCLTQVQVVDGTPYSSQKNISMIASIISPKFNKNDMSTLGSAVPLMFYRYQTAPWSVFYNASILTNITAGHAMHAVEDILETVLGSMYPVYRGIATGPKIDALNSLIANVRRLIMAVVGADNPLSFAEAFARAPDTVWETLRPNATLRDWQLLEDLLIRSRRIGSNLTYYDLAEREDDFLNIWMPVAMGAPLSPSLALALRDVPYSEFVYATLPYLEYLQQNPFVNIYSVEIAENVTVPFTKLVFPIYKVGVRGISAYDEADWAKMIKLGVIAGDDPLVKILSDPSVCCAANKTQLLVQSALKGVRKWLLSQKFFDETTLQQTISYLSWILPYKESVVPRWVSRSLLKYSINTVSLVPRSEIMFEFAWMGFTESVLHVRHLTRNPHRPPSLCF